MASITLHSERPHLEGFRYFWLKTVTGFTPSVHCARSLVGEYQKFVGASMAAGVSHEIPHDAGTVLYLCGVASPYRWERNAHLAFRLEPGASCEVDLYQGDKVVVDGAVALPFDDKAARSRFPEKGAAFLTCRNFQFGAQYF